MRSYLLITQVPSAVLFFYLGVIRIITPYDELASNHEWVRCCSPQVVTLIGAIELTSALGLLLYPLTRRYVEVTIISAFGLAILMLGAATVQLRLGDLWVALYDMILMTHFLLLTGVRIRELRMNEAERN